jgi:hypothetical protein
LPPLPSPTTGALGIPGCWFPCLDSTLPAGESAQLSAGRSNPSVLQEQDIAAPERCLPAVGG